MLRSQGLWVGFMLVLHQISFAQTEIKGVIVDSLTGAYVTNQIRIVFKDRQNPYLMEYTTTFTGKFHYTLKNAYNHLLIRFISTGYYADKTIDLGALNKPQYELKIKLQVLRVEQLREVVIESDRRIMTHGDTIRYDVKKFRTGDERKLKDLINKLPGLEITPDGKISFQGKTVSTLLLDGDDLFGRDYATGTKHINADVVDKVELYGHYNRNRLLKGIASSDELALNVILKENIADWSGDVTLGLGPNTRPSFKYDTDASLLGIAKHFKVLNVAAYNNTGVNNSPVSFGTIRYTPDEVEEMDRKAEYLIEEPYFSAPVPEENQLYNHQQFYNVSSAFHIRSKWKGQFQIYYVQDKFYWDGSAQSMFYTADGNEFRYEEWTKVFKNPRYGKANLQLDYHCSKNNSIHINTEASWKKTGNLENILTRRANRFDQNLLTNEYFLSQKIHWTKRINNFTAQQWRLTYSSSGIKERLTVRNIMADTAKQQAVAHGLTYFSAQWIRYVKRNKLTASYILGADYGQHVYTAKWDDIAKMSYHKVFPQNEFYADMRMKWQFIRWTFKHQFHLGTFRIDNEDRQAVYTAYAKIIFHPTSRMRYFVSATLKKEPLLPGGVLDRWYMTGYMNFRKKNYRPAFHTTKNAGGGFRHKIPGPIGVIQMQYLHSVTEGGYYSIMNLDDRRQFIQYVYAPGALKSDYFSATLENFFPLLKLNVKWTVSYQFSQYMSAINTTTFQYRNINTTQFKMSFGTAFDGFFNFYNRTTWRINRLMEINQSNKILQQQWGIIGNRKWLSIKIDNRIWVFLNKIPQVYHATDIRIRFKKWYKNFSLELIGKNLFGNGQLHYKTIFESGIFVESYTVQKPFGLVVLSYDF